jgi:hypothetical protein
MNINTTLHELEEYFGIKSWLELYKVIEARQLQNEQMVVLMQTPKAGSVTRHIMVPVAEPDQVISRKFFVTEVKALAFDEVYHRLPRRSSKALIKEIVGEIAIYGGKHMAGDVLTFIDNIPTRYEEPGD